MMKKPIPFACRQSCSPPEPCFASRNSGWISIPPIRTEAHTISPLSKFSLPESPVAAGDGLTEFVTFEFEAPSKLVRLFRVSAEIEL